MSPTTNQCCTRCRCAAVCLVDGEGRFVSKLHKCDGCGVLLYRKEKVVLEGQAGKVIMTLGWHKVDPNCVIAFQASLGCRTHENIYCSQCVSTGRGYEKRSFGETHSGATRLKY